MREVYLNNIFRKIKNAYTYNGNSYGYYILRVKK